MIQINGINCTPYIGDEILNKVTCGDTVIWQRETPATESVFYGVLPETYAIKGRLTMEEMAEKITEMNRIDISEASGETIEYALPRAEGADWWVGTKEAFEDQYLDRVFSDTEFKERNDYALFFVKPKTSNLMAHELPLHLDTITEDYGEVTIDGVVYTVKVQYDDGNFNLLAPYDPSEKIFHFIIEED